jgi:hypothetical protein
MVCLISAFYFVRQSNEYPPRPIFFSVLQLVLILLLLLPARLLVADKLADAVEIESFLNRPFVFNEDDELIIALAIEGYRTDSDLFIYQSPEVTMYPISIITEELNFAYEFDLDSLTMTGWQGEEENTLSADFRAKQLYLRGVRQDWPENLRYAEDGFDLYLDQQTIQNWLSITFELDISQLQINISSDEPIPLLEKLKREAKQQKIKDNQVKIETYPDDYRRNQYAWWDIPNLDLTFGYDATTGNEQTEYRQSFVMQGRGDILKHSLRSSYIINDDEADLRLTFSKASEGPNESLFLGFDRYEFGDVTSFTDPLIFSSVKGRGLFLERGRESAQDRGDTITIEGDAPPNWEVELYRNGKLIEFSQTTADGRYEFLSVPTFFGENNFEVRLYGPQGQFRVAREQVTVGGSMLKKGEWEYQIYAINRNKNLIDSALNTNGTESNFFAGQTSYGLSQHFSLRAGASQLTLNGSNTSKNYIYGALLGGFAGGLGELNIAQDDSNSLAGSALWKTRLLGTNLNFDFSRFDEFISDKNLDGNLLNDINVRVDRLLYVGLPSSILFDLNLSQQTYQSGLEANQISNRLSTGWAGFQLAHELNFSSRNTSDNVNQLGAEFSITRSWGAWRLKSVAGYRIQPVGYFDDVSFGASHSFENGFSFNGTATYDIRNNNALSIDNNVTVNWDKFDLTFNARFNSQGPESFGLIMSTSLGYEDRQNNFYFTNESLVSDSSLTARVFIDENNNQVYDVGEEPLEGARFAGSGRWSQTETDNDGFATLHGIPSLEMQKIELNDKSLFDPFLQPSNPPVYLYTHAGTHTFLDIPVAQTVEVEGFMQLERDGLIKPGAGFSIYLTDLQGQRMAETTAEFDGIFLFEPMLPGDYCVALDESDIEKKKIQAPALGCFSLKGDEGVYFIDDITLSRL